MKLKKPKEEHLPKRSRAERHKSFNRFKDTSNKCFGTPFSKVGVCLKFDCINRNYHCDSCIRFSDYVRRPK